MNKILQLSLLFVFVLGGYGAMAQDDTQAVGSSHTFKVNVNDPANAHTGNTYTWVVKHNDAGTTPAVENTEYAFIGVSTGADIKTATIQWLKAGDYLVELSEANKNGSCSTIRQVNILVTGGAIDLLVDASAADGNKLGVDALTDCNDQSGMIIANAEPSDFGTSVRYFAVSMTTDTQPWEGAWSFDFVVNQKHGTTDIATPATVALVTGAQGSISGSKVTVNATNSKVILAVTVQNTPGVSPANDITLNLVASDAVITTAGGDTGEDAGNLANNTPDSHVIQASPNTSVITID